MCIRDRINAQKKTQQNKSISLVIAFDYGGRNEIVNTVKKILDDDIDSKNVTEELFDKYINKNEVPDPDLIIRTGGEYRLSNFLIWQSAYSEFYTSEVLWPDFSKYDFLNDIFSFGLHRFWKTKLLDILNPTFGEKWIDLCCGTGDMSMLLARYIKSSKNITGIDSASQALLVARERSKQNYSSIEWINGDALETSLTSHQFDGLLMAYGLRNLSSPYSGLEEAFRILKPGGRAGICLLYTSDAADE